MGRAGYFEKKIFLCAFIIILLMMVVGAAGYIGLDRVLSVMRMKSGIDFIFDTVSSLHQKIDQYRIATHKGDTDLQKILLENAHQNFEDAETAVTDTAAIFSEEKELTEMISALNQAIADDHFHFQRLVAQEKAGRTMSGTVQENIASLGAEIREAGFWISDMLVALRLLENSFEAFLNRSVENNWENVQKELANFKTEMDQWIEKTNSSEALKKIGLGLSAKYQATKESLQKYQEGIDAQESITSEIGASRNRIDEILSAIRKSISHKLEKTISTSKGLIVGFLLAGLLSGLFFAMISVRSLSRKTHHIINGLSSAFERLKEISADLLDAGRETASNASQQAAAIEETSSSLEEIAAMTRGNAENATAANHIMTDTRAVIDHSYAAMNELVHSMAQMKQAGQDTSAIIKTIDEIAFQTNLLALNAAVESARAGDAGKGFGVVAGEVKNLAVRTAAATGETTALIQETIRKVSDGGQMVNQTESAFKKVLESFGRAAALLKEISAASDEQARGIGQIHTTIEGIDQSVQQNAEKADASASLAEELKDQAQRLQEHIDELVRLGG